MSKQRIAILSALALILVGFTPTAAATEEIMSGQLPVPQNVGEVTWPVVALVAVYMLRDARPHMTFSVTFEVGQESKRWVETLWSQFRRTFRRTFDADDPPSDDPKG